MIPESVGAVISFLLLIAPGYVWDRQSARHTPELRTTTLREAAHIVFSSIIPSSIAGVILLPVWLCLPRVGVFPILLLAAGLLTSALACGIAYAWSRYRFRGERASVGEITTGSALFKALVTLPRSSGITEVVVNATMQDGTLWRGVHAAHDVDPDESPRMLLLKSPLIRRGPGADNVDRFELHEYVVLPLEEVRSLQLTYLRSKTAGR